MKTKHDPEGHECPDCKPLPFNKILNEHTPLPWRYKAGEIITDTFKRPEVVIAELKLPTNLDMSENEDQRERLSNECDANAAYIVRAVNAHDDLVTACKAALHRWGKLAASAEIGEPNKVGDMLVKAIAKAEGV